MRSPPQAEDPKRQDEQKSSTIYVQNLNEKVHLVELKNSLFQLFSNIGVDVLEVHAKKNIKMRGQAFVVCGSEEQAATLSAPRRTLPPVPRSLLKTESSQTNASSSRNAVLSLY